MTRIEPPGKSIQFALIQSGATALADDAIARGYDRQNVAEALLRAARDVLGSDDQFMTALNRYLKPQTSCRGFPA
jgi:hypothetical protein